VVVAAACGRSLPITSPSQAASACAARVETSVLPDWARQGFSEPEPSVAHEIGRSGEIAAIVFGDQLVSPPIPDRMNKILWVPRHATSAPKLDISAQRMDGSVPVGDPVERSVAGGPGPSIIDLPEAGCWRLTLSWADRTDSLDLEYVSAGG
jgi:hypothetical protein